MSSAGGHHAPRLDVPSASSIVSVRVIDSTSFISYPTKFFLQPPIAGHDDLSAPAYSFLITNVNGSKPRHILFDLGVRKDTENLAPAMRAGLKKSSASVTVESNVADILDDAPTAGKSTPKSTEIEAVIWSHHHFDHTGDTSTFPASTTLIVGPGFTAAKTPAYPTDPDSPMTESDWAGRELREISFPASAPQIGHFPALDYFGDGSFYLLDTPGHAVGHLCGLARVSSGPDSFVFMGGDAAHHPAEFRPTEHRPLPAELALPSSRAYHGVPCPGEVVLAAVEQSRRKDGADMLGGRTRPWYEPNGAFCYERSKAEETIAKIEGFDAHDNVFVVIAHDATLKATLKFFPEEINAWVKDELAEKSRWRFVDNFSKAVDEYAVHH